MPHTTARPYSTTRGEIWERITPAFIYQLFLGLFATLGTALLCFLQAPVLKHYGEPFLTIPLPLSIGITFTVSGLTLFTLSLHYRKHLSGGTSAALLCTLIYGTCTVYNINQIANSPHC